MKKTHFLFFLIILTALLAISGCSGSNFAAKASIPTPTPISTPTPTPTPTLSPEQQEEKDLLEKLALAPDNEGTEKVIKEINSLKRETYEKDGVYIGELKKSYLIMDWTSGPNIVDMDKQAFNSLKQETAFIASAHLADQMGNNTIQAENDKQKLMELTRIQFNNTDLSEEEALLLARR